MATSRDEAPHGRSASGHVSWTVGADGLASCAWSDEQVQMPTGRLHAVSGEGLLAGRAVCLAPVVLLDPLDWQWPDDGSFEWPPCWVCLALTR